MSSSFKESLSEAMAWLGRQRDTIFVGQSVACGGTAMSSTFDGVPKEKRLEFPVAEELQLGVCIGLALEGYTPLCYFPRWNFLLLAADMLVNHLDRLPLYSGYRPRVIIRVAVGSREPLDPGPQHADDFSDAFYLMLRHVDMVRVKPGHALVAYQHAYASGWPTIIVEDACC
jgi:pyruvate/2-oxoglutarate/acetoin dehydrogenase E1 component